jgi:hypothetical protein
MKFIWMLAVLLQYGCASCPITCKPDVVWGNDITWILYGRTWVSTGVDGGRVSCGCKF